MDKPLGRSCYFDEKEEKAQSRAEQGKGAFDSQANYLVKRVKKSQRNRNRSDWSRSLG